MAHPPPHAGHAHHGYSVDAATAASAWHAAAYASASPLGHFYRTGAAPGSYDHTMADWAAATGHYAATAASTAAAASTADSIGVDPLQQPMEEPLSSAATGAMGNLAAEAETPPKQEYKVNATDVRSGQISPGGIRGEQFLVE